jgi:hypothetical protein
MENMAAANEAVQYVAETHGGRKQKWRTEETQSLTD